MPCGHLKCEGASPIKTILFDINETVLNLDGLRSIFNTQFNGAISVEHWFSTLLHSSTICALTDVETTFADLAKITLANVIHSQSDQPEVERRQFRGNLIKEENQKFINEALSQLSSLQAHEDIIPALTLLKENGFKTVAFSNSSSNLIENQIKNAGLNNHFDEIISVESTGTFKPHNQVYHFAAVKLSEEISNLTLVACHDWDTHGALTVGMRAAFVKRGKIPYNPLYKKADFEGHSMIDIAEQIIKKYQR